jgi:hypothetical protein
MAIVAHKSLIVATRILALSCRYDCEARSFDDASEDKLQVETDIDEGLQHLAWQPRFSQS